MRKLIKDIGFLVLVIAVLTGCDKNITEFGFDGNLSGTVKDPSGNMVPGDITSDNLVVHALAEGDQTAIDIRVRGDGTFQNSKLYPVKTKVWLTGPVFPQTPDTIIVDFSKTSTQTLDLEVTPFITIAKPEILNKTSTSVEISYNMSGNNGKTPDVREVYCSTIPYPTSSTGSGPFYHTEKLELNDDAGVIVINGLTSGTEYHLRIGARADEETMNYSEQVIFTAP